MESNEILRKNDDEIIERKEEIGRIMQSEEGKKMVEGIGEKIRERKIFDLFEGE